MAKNESHDHAALESFDRGKHLLRGGLRYRLTWRGWERLVGHRWAHCDTRPYFPPDSAEILPPSPEVTL